MSSKIKYTFYLTLLLILIPPKNTFAQVLLNEFSPKGSPEWVEIINKGSSEINLEGYYFDDDDDFNSDEGNSPKIKLQGLFAAGSLCYLDINTFLNDSGDKPTLFAANGDILDSYSYASSSANLSYSRIPDGGDWQINTAFSKTQNMCFSLPTPTPTSSPTQSATTTPTAASTKSPTPNSTVIPTTKPLSTKTPSPKPSTTETPESEEESEIISIETSKSSSTSSGIVAGAQTSSKSPVFAIIFIVLGILLLGYGGFNVYKNMKSEYNRRNEKDS